MKFNINHDWLIKILIASPMFGAIWDGWLTKIILLIVILYGIALFDKKKLYNLKKHYIFLIIFLILGIILYLQSENKIIALKEICHLVFFILIFNSLVMIMATAKNPLHSLIGGWNILFVTVGIIGLFELIFDIHMPYAIDKEKILEIYDSEYVVRRVASVTFMNVNSYSTLLLFTLPYLLSRYISVHNNKIIGFLNIFLISFIIVVNGSRGATLGLICALIFFIIFIKNYLILFFCIIFYVVAHEYTNFASTIIYRFQESGLSDLNRYNIILEGFSILEKTRYIGVGPGNFMVAMEGIGSNITSPHNFLLELVVQYGFLAILIWAIMIKGLVKDIIQIWGKIDNSIKIIFITTLCIIPFVLIIDSGYMQSIIFWNFLFSLLVISNKNLYAQSN